MILILQKEIWRLNKQFPLKLFYKKKRKLGILHTLFLSSKLMYLNVQMLKCRW